jgi:excinuclease ABC subunit C
MPNAPWYPLLTVPALLRWARRVDLPRQPSVSPREAAARLPSGPGVYRFRDAAGHVLYLGRAASLRRRVVSYWGELGDRDHLAAMVARIARVEAVPCDSAHEAAWLERNLLQVRKPPWNRSRSGGQEVEVWIRLSESAPAPGVTVTHQRRAGDRARYFGPYLGGRNARDAVSGLVRVLALGPGAGWAGDRAGGTERELARARGAALVDRELARARGAALVDRELARAGGAALVDRADLVRAATAVLDRDPAAVAALRAELIRRRDAAAAILAFEFAGRVQAELEALDWVTAEQKVTMAIPCDFDVYGWASGVQVRFEVRGGRLCGWSQRACGAAAARRYLASPHQDRGPAWTAFAARAAELAARLRR